MSARTFVQSLVVSKGLIQSGVADTIAVGDLPSLSSVYQPLDATLTAFAALTIAANSVTLGTGADAFSQITLGANTFLARSSSGNAAAKTITDFGLSLVDDVDAAAGRTTLGLGTIATQAANNVAITGGTITGMSSPSGSSDVATKGYVDNLAAGIKWKQSVRVATTTNGTLATAYENGDTVDGVTLATGDRILLKNQTTATENGIYIVAASGAPSRSTDADSGTELVSAAVFVQEGTANADVMFICTNDSITIGVTNIVFVQFSSAAGMATTALDNLASVAINSALLPGTSDSIALGSSSKQWSDAYLGSGALIDFANGNAVITHSSGILTVSTGDLRVTTVGANSASVVTVGGTQTLTAKTLSSPALNTATVGTSLVPTSNDGAPLGDTTHQFSDLFVASGAVLNFANGDVTITHSSGLLTLNAPVTVSKAIAATIVPELTLKTSTAATAGNQKWSGALVFTANGWKTNTTAASEAVDFALVTIPTEGAAHPTGRLAFNYQVAGGGYTEVAYIDSNGFGYFTGSLAVVGSISNQAVIATQQAVGASVVNGFFAQTTTSATSGNQKWSPAIVLSGFGWQTTGPASEQVDFALVCVPVQGTTHPSAKLSFYTQINSGGWAEFTSISASSFFGAADGQIVENVGGVPTGVPLPASIFDLRLTLTSGVPVTSSDVTGATSIYLTPFNGDRAGLYDGTRNRIVSLAELTLSLGTLVAFQMYDVFLDWNSGTPALAMLEWANASVTFTSATPTVVTWTSHGMTTGQAISFTTTGAMPTGVSANTQYWVTVVNANTFKISSSYFNCEDQAYVAASSTGSSCVGHNPQARQTALAQQSGIGLVLSGTPTKRYVGSFFTTATTTTEDSYAARLLVNWYNQQSRPLRLTPGYSDGGLSTTYNVTTTYALLNSDSGARGQFVSNGISPTRILFTPMGDTSAANTALTVYLSINPTIAYGINAGYDAAGVDRCSALVEFEEILAAGYYMFGLWAATTSGTGLLYADVAKPAKTTKDGYATKCSGAVMG